MHIERLQVEGGFLDGLDLDLKPGLNTIIGARGTGKTSIIELIRFCLSLPSFSDATARKSVEHVQSILGDGRATVSINANGHTRTLSRSLSDPPSRDQITPSPLIFAQTEIENIGLHSSGRLRLIDAFVKQQDKEPRLDASPVLSLSADIASIRREIKELEESLEILPELDKQLVEVSAKEKLLAFETKEWTQKKSRLDKLSNEAAGHQAAIEFFERHERALSVARNAVESTREDLALEDWPLPSEPEQLQGVAENLKKVKNHLHASVLLFEASTTLLETLRKEREADRVKAENVARNLRREFERHTQGTGAVLREASRLKEAKARLDTAKKMIAERRKKELALCSRRAKHLQSLEESADARSDARAAICAHLSKVLSPRIRARVLRSANTEDYRAKLTSALRGSGLKHIELASTIASNVSPRELVEIVDSNDAERLSEAAELSSERASRVVAHLRFANLGELATAAVDDDIELSLLDGTDYKPIGDLSTGQRCTVVLPILLEHGDRILIVDQPEDHIDNAFIVDTLIKALRARGAVGQVIASTHNPNIPVLGDASIVIQMASDGRRGFCAMAEPLDSDKAVHAVCSVMEGGREAFKKRAAFYK